MEEFWLLLPMMFLQYSSLATMSSRVPIMTLSPECPHHLCSELVTSERPTWAIISPLRHEIAYMRSKVSVSSISSKLSCHQFVSTCPRWIPTLPHCDGPSMHSIRNTSLLLQPSSLLLSYNDVTSVVHLPRVVPRNPPAGWNHGSPLHLCF